ncbi:MAG: hypothetical protein M1829_001023 [Trizodia sp. TS-e1964]|nr:MAG: hypothetical protein M1829_001023 [Trizodia sp. TS-e1964]
MSIPRPRACPPPQTSSSLQADSLAGAKRYPPPTNVAFSLSDAPAGAHDWQLHRHVEFSRNAKPKTPSAQDATRNLLSGKLHRHSGSVPRAQFLTTTPATDFHNPTLSSLSRPTNSRGFHDDNYAMAPPSPSAASMSNPKTKIKPLFKKLTGESNSLDLSRSAAENESLGVYGSDYGLGSRSAADVSFAPAGRRGYHNRSTSGASQFSTTTNNSANRPGAQYIHPMRQTPRPYTPPAAKSYPTSVVGSEYSSDANKAAGMDEEEQIRLALRNASYRSSSFNSPRSTPPPLRIQTNSHSLTRLTASSQTNLAGTPSSLRPRADTMSAADTISPISRTSFDRGFRIRSNTDPTARAESIRAAREAFTAKENAKAEKAERESLKVAERKFRKQEKRGRAGSKKSDTGDTLNGQSVSNEKVDGLVGREYSSLTPAHNQVRLDGSHRTEAGASKKGAAKNGWVGFITWLRTRILKLGRRMSGRSA